MKEVHPLLCVILFEICWLTWPATSIPVPVPVIYDQRQEGDFNLHAQLENVVVVLIPAAVLPQIAQQLSKADALKPDLLADLIKDSSLKNVLSKENSFDNNQKIRQKQLATMPNFPVFQVSNITDPDEPFSTSTELPSPQENENATKQTPAVINNLGMEGKPSEISDSERSRVLIAQSPTVVLHQKTDSSVINQVKIL